MKSIFAKPFVRSVQLGVILSLLFTCSLDRVRAQRPQFSQYYASELYLSPCFAARESHFTIGANARTQWLNLTTPYNSNQLSIIYPIYLKKKRVSNLGGVGLSVFTDEAGSLGLNTTGFYFSMAYNQPLSRNDLHHLYFGLQGGMIQRSIDLGEVQSGNQFNPASEGGFDATLTSGVTGINSRASGTDFAAGISYYFNPDKNYKLSDFSGAFGLAAYHLTDVPLQLVESDSEGPVLPMVLKTYGSFTWHCTRRVYVKPNGLVSLEGDETFVTAGAYANIVILNKHTTIIPHKVRLGMYYRFDDAVVPVIGFGNEFYNLGFSYDWSTSFGNATTAAVNTYEISLQLEFYHPDKDESLISQPRYKSKYVGGD